jgi:RNA polymerase sigma-70 factor (ECF subfamily)
MGPSQRENLSLLTDLDLISRYKATLDKNYVGELFKRYSHLVLGLCINYYKDKDDAKDALLQIFEKLFDELQKHKVENFKNWLCFVSRNHCISALRKQKTETSRMLDYNYTTEKQTEPELRIEKPDKEDEYNKLEEAIQALSSEQRICVELFYLKEKSYNEIVAATRFSLKQVKSFLQNGKRNLKIILTQKNERIPAK